MDYVVNDEKVHPGEVILTSGEDRIFPKGLPIGVVKDSSQAMPFQIIHVQPAVHLDRLEDVLVLLTRQDVSLKPAEIPVDPNAAAIATPAARARIYERRNRNRPRPPRKHPWRLPLRRRR